MMRKTPVERRVTGLPVGGQRLPNANAVNHQYSLLYDYIQYLNSLLLLDDRVLLLMTEYFCI